MNMEQEPKEQMDPSSEPKSEMAEEKMDSKLESRPGWNSILRTAMWVAVGVVVLGGGYYLGANWSGMPANQNGDEQQMDDNSMNVEFVSPVKVKGDYIVYKGSSDENFSGAPSYYKFAEISGGEWDGYELVIARAKPAGPAFYDNYYRFVVGPDMAYFLSRQSDSLDDQMLNAEIDSTTRFNQLSSPSRLENPNNADQGLVEVDYSDHSWFADMTGLKAQFEDDTWGTVYVDSTTRAIPPAVNNSNPRGGFYIQMPDGTARTYALEVPFISQDGRASITWTEGGSNTASYRMTDVGGCGAENVASVMPASLKSSLVKSGTARYGSSTETVYELNSINHPLMAATFSDYQVWNDDNITINQFAANHPLFFWEDSFGRIIKFTNDLYIPGAECGKPVIYLYPETKTQVRVEVNPIGGFSYTDPEYGTGWEVMADPSGSLVNLADGKTYPYLFWEGRGGIYESPDKGWVVTQAQVEATIDDKLGQYGLNGTEIADFKEYWIPRMQDAPYYFISFYGTQVMDQLAPLKITPEPDTVIRVLMDFKPLQRPIKVNDYKITSLPREGFTVIEWGGVIK